MRFILIAAVAVFAAGCAQPVWVKPGASQSDFATDRYTCMQDSQQRVGGAVVNQFGGSATNTVVTNGNLFRSCMNAKGWYLTQPSTQQQSPNAGPLPSSGPAAPNPLAEVDREASRQAELHAPTQLCRCFGQRARARFRASPSSTWPTRLTPQSRSGPRSCCRARSTTNEWPQRHAHTDLWAAREAPHSRNFLRQRGET